RARRRGSAPDFAFASAWRAWVLAREGRLEEAEVDARASADLALPQGWFVMGPVILGYLVDVLVDRGELGDAERLLADSGIARRRASARSGCWARPARGARRAPSGWGSTRSASSRAARTGASCWRRPRTSSTARPRAWSTRGRSPTSAPRCGAPTTAPTRASR